MTDTDDLLRFALVALALLVAAPLLLMGVMLPTMGLWFTGGMGPGMMTGGGGLWWVAVTFVPLLLLGLVGYGLYRLLSGDDGDTALEELRLAYARGDLTDDEYETRRERLRD